MKTKTIYLCGVCETEYPTLAEAEECEARAKRMSPRFKVGDVVTGRSGFGWFNGDPAWISNPEVAAGGKPEPGGVSTKGSQPGHGNCFGDCCTYSFFYVVTAIDEDTHQTSLPHRVRYHVATKAMSGTEGYRNGYTFDDGHVTLTKVSNPPDAVVKGLADLIGEKSETLL